MVKEAHNGKELHMDAVKVDTVLLGLIPISIDVDIPTTGNQGTDRTIIRSN